MKVKLILMLFILWGHSFDLLADMPKGYKMEKNSISFYVCAPPALVYVQNEQGQITGADPSLPIDQYGVQNNGQGGLNQIPFSFVDQQNIGSDDSANQGQPQTCTGYTVYIWDGPKQTYVVNLKGVASGIAELDLLEGFVGDGNTISSAVSVFVSNGQTKKINVVFDPSVEKISEQLIISNNDLLTDVQTACQLGQITSPLACRFLTDEAKLIQTALEKNHEQEAEDLTWVFLHSLGYSRPVGCKDEDHHAEVKQPALGILQEDAKALLKELK